MWDFDIRGATAGVDCRSKTNAREAFSYVKGKVFLVGTVAVSLEHLETFWPSIGVRMQDFEQNGFFD